MSKVMEEDGISEEKQFHRAGKPSYTVKLKEFEGPLDLLLYLIKNSEVNIYDISISEITGQYLSYLTLLISMDLDRISEFIEMAATLIYMKSRALLPVDVEYEEEEEDPKEELIAKLLEYQKYKIASNVLENLSEESSYIPRKIPEPLLFELNEDDENWKPLSIIELVGAFAEVLNRKSADKPNSSIEIEKLEFTVEEKMEYVQRLLSDKDHFSYFEVIREDMSKIELVCTFLAILELVKQGEIFIRQHKLFGDINIVQRKMLSSSLEGRENGR